MTYLIDNFNEKTTTKKGDIGENIVDNIMLKKGFIPYMPKEGTGAHPFDRLYATRDKKTIFILDIKAKAKRRYYPDTGIDLAHYRQYSHISDKYKIEVVILFVDEESLTVYGGKLINLEAETTITDKSRTLKYPMIVKNIIYFPIKNMIHVSGITQEEAKALKIMTTKKECYKT